MNAIDWIAEQRIAEAIARGDFDDLPGAGKPLVLDDDTLVPPELRMAYRILRNARMVPSEPAARGRAAARLMLLEMRLEARGARLVDTGYYGKVARRVRKG